MVETKPQDTVRPLKGRRMLVLGASSGFGRNIMRALNSAGAQVVVADTNAEGLARIDGAIPWRSKVYQRMRCGVQGGLGVRRVWMVCLI